MFDSLVIGGGIAGLAAAWRLKQHGATVRVLEAQSNPGGRIRTVWDQRHSAYVELGGELIGTRHQTVLGLCNEFNVPLTESLVSDELLPDRILLGDQELSSSDVFNLRRELTLLIEELVTMAEHIDPIEPSIGEAGQMALDSMSVDDWLTQRKYSQSLRSTFSDLPSDSQSMLGLLALIAGGGGRDFFYESERFVVERGAYSLVLALLAALQDCVEVGVRSHAVEVSNGGILIESLRSDGSRVEHVAKTVILAVPLPVVPRIAGLPRLDVTDWPTMCRNEKMTLFAEFTGETPIVPFRLLTDRVYRVVDCRVERPSCVSPYMRLDVFIRPNRHAECLLDRHSIGDVLKLSGLTQKTEYTIYQSDWCNSQSRSGSYAVFGKNVFRSDYRQVLSGVPPIFFAGDYVIPGFAGFLEGAARSGYFAADRAAHCLGGRPAAQTDIMSRS